MAVKRFSIQKFLAIGFFLLFSAGSWAEEPSSDVLKSFMSFSLPAGWSVVDLTIDGSTNFGTENNPFYKQKFTAKVFPDVPRYIHVKWLGGTEVIDLYASSEKTLTVNGIASSELANERWNSKFEFSGEPFTEGKPIGSFSSSSVMLGSEDESAVIEKMQAEKIAQDRAKSDAEAKKRAARAEAERLFREKQIRFQNLITKYSAIDGVNKLTSSNSSKPKDARFPLRAGDTYYLVLDGNIKRGNCKGSEKYKVNSTLNLAAVHSGVLTPGQRSVIKVRIVAHNNEFGRSKSNGVSCGPHSIDEPVAMQFQKMHDSNYNEL